MLSLDKPQVDTTNEMIIVLIMKILLLHAVRKIEEF